MALIGQEGFPTVSGKPKNIKQHNQRLILSILQNGGVYAVGDLSRQISMSKTTALKIINNFCESGIVCSAGKGNSTNEGGKKPELFMLNPEYRYSLVVSLAIPYELVCAAVNFSGQIVHMHTASLSPDLDYSETVKVIALAISRAMDQMPIKSKRLCGISIACDEIIDTLTGSIICSKHHSWGRNLPIKQDLSEQLNFKTPIYVDNICRFAGYAELLSNDLPQYDDLITIWCDNQAGGCILSNRQLIDGFNGIVGDFGHIMVDPSSDVVCPGCGRRGCLESLISRPAVLQYASNIAEEYLSSPSAAKAKGGTLTMEDIFASQNNDPLSRHVIDHIISCLSYVIYNIASLTLQTNRGIILQGMYTAAGNYFLDKLNQSVQKFNRFEVYNDIQIVYSQYGVETQSFYHEAFIRGAALFAVNQYIGSLIPDKPGNFNLTSQSD